MNSPTHISSRMSSNGGDIPDTHQKALAVNLDATSFGSFAEIGAGQEVARWFLRVGAASGTVAKTISAYDKVVSDALYGTGTRYVSKPRLEAMLEGEWESLVHQVGAARSATTRLFAFADTIAARNFAGTNDCHGWIGLRFQDRPLAEPSTIMLHVNLRDTSNLLQQEAVGAIGVNLIHELLTPPSSDAGAATRDLATRLFDNLAEDRVEVDQVEMYGGAFSGYDVQALHLELAFRGRAEAVAFSKDGLATAANEFFYKRAVILSPAAADASDDVSAAAIAACVQSLRSEVAGNAEVKDVVDVRLMTAAPDSSQPANAALGRISALVTRHQPLYRATAFVRRYTQAPLRFAMTLPALMRIFDDVRYQHLDGRLLEGVARLFGHDVRVLAYPCRKTDLLRHLGREPGHAWTIDDRNPWITADQVRPAAPLGHLYDYLLATGFLVAMPPQVESRNS